MSELRRILPDPRVRVTEWDSDGYAARIAVQMGDGAELVYGRIIIQPEPQLVGAEFISRIFRDNGGYQGKHTKK